MDQHGRDIPYFALGTESNGDGWRAYNPVDGETYELNAHARHVLRLCDGSRRMDEIAATIGAEYGMDPRACLQTLSGFLDPLTEAGAVWWRDRRLDWRPVPPPQSVFWELTWRCNLRCVHCVVSAGEREGAEPTTQELKGIAWQLARAGVQSVTYSGGEPLIRPDFFEIAEHVARLGLGAQMATNGMLVNASVATRLHRLGIDVQITLNGATAGVHDAFTGVRGSFDRARGAIALLVAAGAPVTVATVATTMSAADVPAIVDLAVGMGVQTYRLIPFVPSGRGRTHAHLELSPASMRELTTMLRQVRVSGAIHVLPLEFEETLDACPALACPMDTHIGCDGAIGYCTISPTGEVLPCSYFAGVDAVSLRDRPFRWIWDHSRFLAYFRSLVVADLEGACAACPHLPVCRGGCRATNRAAGDLFSANLHCWLAQAEAEQTGDGSPRAGRRRTTP